MNRSYGYDVLSEFDITEEDHEFLVSLLDLDVVPPEDKRHIIDLSLTAGAEDWFYLIQCAKAIRDRNPPEPATLEGQDVLSYLPIASNVAIQEKPWARTDYSLLVAKKLGDRARAQLSSLKPSVLSNPLHQDHQRSQGSRREKKGHVSHYWGRATDGPWSTSDTIIRNVLSKADTTLVERHPMQANGETLQLTPHAIITQEEVECPQTTPLARLSPPKRATKSPYFEKFQSPAKEKSPRSLRPAPGVVSSVPFPPLDAPTFGLIQERQAHEPFWLLIAVTFLIKTRGTVAVPVFERVKLQFPSAAAIADPSHAEAIMDMIRPLGLAKNRLAFLRKYANGFLHMPPAAERRYRVPGYDHRDPDVPMEHSLPDGSSVDDQPTTNRQYQDDPDAWEIGHLTKGKYALDSWRIFCRDELLGRAKDWNGLGREGEFQPEWMRVRPDDKELRAYLRWLWMREGWEWDPRTGEKVILREELRRAVNEGRVEYDDMGELRILDNPR